MYIHWDHLLKLLLLRDALACIVLQAASTRKYIKEGIHIRRVTNPIKTIKLKLK
jgi:hypothetical protein